MIENASDVLIMPLERFRKEQISAAKEARKKYDKETEKYCAVLEKHLSLSAKKKESHLHEADNQVDNVRQHFYEVSLEYVFKVQEVQERKMFDFVEPQLLTTITVISSFVSTWVKYYCTYHREPKRVTMVLFDPKSGGKTGEEESFTLKSCTRRKTDSIEKRFCFDVEAVDRPGVMTMQALSEEDRRLWMEAMDGREPVYNLNRDNQAEGMAQLDVIGFNVMKKFIYAVETRGINDQGLYRIVGVNSRVQKLLGLAMDPKTCADVELENSEVLPAPLMTYQYQRSFIKAAKLDNQEARVTEIHALVHRLPEKNRQMLELLIKHLATVANHHQQNLMTIANLGVVFGPTLLRPQEETVAAIMDIKFQNIVVEILIEHHEKIFREVPISVGVPTNMQLNMSRRTSTESKAPSCSERPLTLFHTPTHSQKGEKKNSVVNTTVAELQQPVSSSTNCNSNSSSSSASSQGRTPRHSLTSNDGEQDTRQIRPSSLLNPKCRGSIPTSPMSPSPTSPRSPSWPMFSAPSSPQPTSSASSDSSPVSIAGRKARALYACKAEHNSELSFIAGTIFENVHASREPGWLEGTLDGRTGLIPENYVDFL
ncbi:hypothetical protein FQN60_000565 [Etheostoma spectabile]|uniref:Uncharacterized protein n=1 Tax=Etheostoma spectabile TaxID=54343 RepID=A0A5J5CZW6_9PERO|nr:hypothetical protein FQN60_000565 [Etheostoma spectabile]